MKPYTHTIYSEDGKIISQRQRTEPLHPAPSREYSDIEAQQAAEAWDLRGTELFKRSTSNMTGAIRGRLQRET